MGSEFETRDSGLVVPVKPQTARLYGPLELQDDGERRRARAALQALLNLPSFSRRGSLPDAARERLLLALAVELLGTDFDYDELC